MEGNKVQILPVFRGDVQEIPLNEEKRASSPKWQIQSHERYVFMFHWEKNTRFDWIFKRQIQSNAIGSSFINSSLFVSNVTQVILMFLNKKTICPYSQSCHTFSSSKSQCICSMNFHCWLAAAESKARSTSSSIRRYTCVLGPKSAFIQEQVKFSIILLSAGISSSSYCGPPV